VLSKTVLDAFDAVIFRIQCWLRFIWLKTLKSVIYNAKEQPKLALDLLSFCMLPFPSL